MKTLFKKIAGWLIVAFMVSLFGAIGSIMANTPWYVGAIGVPVAVGFVCGSVLIFEFAGELIDS